MMRVAITVACLLGLVSCAPTDLRGPTTDPIRVDVGGHRLEVLIEGTDSGRPTVILESGIGGRIEDWATVRESLSRITRVVSYHRAGNGGSQSGPRPRGACRIVEELRSALQALHVAPPYVLVGHSAGGWYVRTYAGLHPDEVGGLVLVDPTLEFREALTPAEVELRLQQCWGADYERIQDLLARVHPKMSEIAAQSMLGLEPYLELVPAHERPATREAWLTRFTDRAQQVEGMLGLMAEGGRQEMLASMDSMRAVRALPVTDEPVILLVAGRARDASKKKHGPPDPMESAHYLEWEQNSRLEGFREFIGSFAAGSMEVLQDSTHDIPKDRPDAIIAAVTQMLGAPGQK